MAFFIIFNPSFHEQNMKFFCIPELVDTAMDMLGCIL
jgi:hypothetical protein